MSAHAKAAPGLAAGVLAAQGGVSNIINGDAAHHWPGTVALANQDKGAPFLAAKAQELSAGLVALKDGVFDVTATQQTQKMGRMAVEMAVKIVGGEKVPAVQLSDATLTTKENVEGFIANHP